MTMDFAGNLVVSAYEDVTVYMRIKEKIED